MCIFLSHSPEGESLRPAQNANHTLGLYTSSNEHWKTLKKGKEWERDKSKQKQETEKEKDKTIILIYFRGLILTDKSSEEWTLTTEERYNLLQPQRDHVDNYVVSYIEGDHVSGW